MMLTASLSAFHLLGFTLVTGSALFANLRLLGALFPERPVVEITATAGRGIAGGLIVSIATGLLSFAPRALSASANSTFRLKMVLLVAAAAFQFAAHRTVARRLGSSTRRLRAIGGMGLVLWLGLALTACAFILLE